ncbi:MAG: DUF5522 domain-containing protein [Acidobacteriota bacterium]|nr:DUF5522 domain-containing protein [Acidobacteriota bacterium]
MNDKNFRLAGLNAGLNERRGDLSEEPLKDGSPPLLVEGEDYYLENGLYVFMESFLRRRGYCCDSGCRHCPYPKESNE